jgi:hypothetical protein
MKKRVRHINKGIWRRSEVRARPCFSRSALVSRCSRKPRNQCRTRSGTLPAFISAALGLGGWSILLTFGSLPGRSPPLFRAISGSGGGPFCSLSGPVRDAPRLDFRRFRGRKEAIFAHFRVLSKTLPAFISADFGVGRRPVLLTLRQGFRASLRALNVFGPRALTS